MSAILNSLNSYNFPIFQLILMKLVSKPMFYRALCHKTYFVLGLASPLTKVEGTCKTSLKCLSSPLPLPPVHIH